MGIIQEIDETQLINDLSLGNQTMFLLGAGCSISSGCKSAAMLVKDFKLRIFCADNGIPFEDTASYSDSEIKGILEKMPSFENDYSHYFGKCFPLPDDRNLYIQKAFKECNPSLGYLCFANYLLCKKVKNVATTNFDRLVNKSLCKLSPNLDIEEISDKSDTIGEHDIRLLFLHGDYHYDLLKNTEDEVQAIGKKLEEKFASYEYSKLVVIGYSGQDKSILSAIKAAISKKPNLRIIWCFHDNHPAIPEDVKTVLRMAESTVAFGIDFDRLFLKLYNFLGQKNDIIDDLVNKREDSVLEFSSPLKQQNEFLLNSFKISKYPFLYVSKENDGSGVQFGDNFYYFEDGLGREKILFSSANVGLQTKIYLMNRFIENSLPGKGLSSYRNIIFKGTPDGFIKQGLEYKVLFMNRDFYLVLSPTYTFAHELSSNEKATINANVSNLYTKRNKELLDQLIKGFFADALIFNVGSNSLEFNSNPSEIRKGCQDFVYTQLSEPEMVVNGFEGKNQLGLAYEHRPTKGFLPKTKIKMAVICPLEKKQKLNAFLQVFAKQGSDTYPGKMTIYKRFSGFNDFTGVELEITGDKSVVIDSDIITSKSQSEFLDLMINSVSRNYESQQPDIVLIFFTKEMERFRKVEGIDFHDALKARLLNSYKTQILEETTMDSKDDKNKILVNLALAIYTKTICLPWVPKSFDKDKFFLGMAFGFDKKGLTVSCSQLFDGAGRGLMLLTSPVTNKQTRTFFKNPFLSEDEAYNLGTAIRGEYYKSLKPYDLRKIVIHRTVPFKPEEIKGFKKAFEGLDDFTLLQIIEYPYENVYPLNRGDLVDGYPAKRGTVVKVDKDSVLLWTDGSVREPEVLGGMTYRSSKQGMGKPIKLKKYCGRQHIEEIAGDILNLTKMDFNSSDALYSRMPVTIKYARILSQMLKYRVDCETTDLIDFRYVM